MVRAVLLAAVLSCLPAGRPLDAREQDASPAGSFDFGFRANVIGQTRTLKLIACSASAAGWWSVRVDWREKERQLDLDVDFGKPVQSGMPHVGYFEADVSRAFPVGDSGVMTPGEITTTFRSGKRVLESFRMTVTDREIAVEPVEPGKHGSVSSSARRYVVVPRSGTVQVHIDPFQPKETLDLVSGLLKERGYRELETSAGTDLHVLSPSWVWRRGTVPTYTFHRRYFEPKDGTKLLTNEEWERLIPENVAARIAAWP
jgi:hypothetical protein